MTCDLSRLVVLLIFVGLVVVVEVRAEEPPFERTEKRESCAEYEALRRPMFGDLHVHTSYSFDSYISSQRNDPAAAYRYAKGEPITLPDEDGEQKIIAQIQRPLDFASVTDHSEYFGQINVCTTDPWRAGYWWPHCVMTRSSNLWVQLFSASWWTSLGGMSENDPSRSFACTLSDCDEARSDTWSLIQQAAEEAYDRSADCSFTSFVGYEYTDAPETNNMHRNVIFRNESVTDNAISTYDTGSYNFPKLWQLLREQCIEGGEGCDVMAIPHNPNLAGGLMFRRPRNSRGGDGAAVLRASRGTDAAQGILGVQVRSPRAARALHRRRAVHFRAGGRGQISQCWARSTGRFEPSARPPCRSKSLRAETWCATH